MSLQTDAGDCLRDAIAERNGVDVSLERFSEVKPSDDTIGAGSATSWLATLRVAAECLRAKGYPTGMPELAKADELRTKVLIKSQGYIEQLSRTRAGPKRLVVIAGVAAGVVVAAALAQTMKDRT